MKKKAIDRYNPLVFHYQARKQPVVGGAFRANNEKQKTQTERCRVSCLAVQHFLGRSLGTPPPPHSSSSHFHLTSFTCTPQQYATSLVTKSGRPAEIQHTTTVQQQRGSTHNTKSTRHAQARSLTSIHAIGQATGPSTIMRVYTSQDMPEAMASWFFPVKTAEGKISPKKSTRDTDRMTASHEGTRFPKNMGSA